MRKAFKATVLTMAGLILAACNTTTEEDFRIARIALNESPTLRAEAIKSCVADFGNDSLNDRIVLANHMNVELSKMPKIACQRLFNAIAKGRITRADISRPAPNEAKIIKILQGQ